MKNISISDFKITDEIALNKFPTTIDMEADDDVLKKRIKKCSQKIK